MDKKAALEYIVGQGKRVTAKVVSIDLDAPISTTTEMLERLSRQGLLERDHGQRPREYAITEEGRKRLEFFKTRDAEAHPAERNRNGNPGASASGAAPSDPGPDGAALSQKLDGLQAEVCSRLDALTEDVRDLLDALVAMPSSGALASAEGASSRVEALLARANRLAERSGESEEEPDPKIAELYQARKERASLAPGWLRDLPEKRAVTATIEKLEGELGEATSESIERLVELESDHRPELEEIARLRGELEIPAASDEETSTPAAEIVG